MIFSSGNYKITLGVKANTDSEKAQILYCNFYPHPDEIIVDNVDKDMDEDCKISVNSYGQQKLF